MPVNFCPCFIVFTIPVCPHPVITTKPLSFTLIYIEISSLNVFLTNSFLPFIIYIPFVSSFSSNSSISPLVMTPFVNFIGSVVSMNLRLC